MVVEIHVTPLHFTKSISKRNIEGLPCFKHQTFILIILNVNFSLLGTYYIVFLKSIPYKLNSANQPLLHNHIYTYIVLFYFKQSTFVDYRTLQYLAIFIQVCYN